MNKPIVLHWFNNNDPIVLDADEIEWVSPARDDKNKLAGCALQINGHRMQVRESAKQVLELLAKHGTELSWFAKVDTYGVAYKLERVEDDQGRLSYELTFGTLGSALGNTPQECIEGLWGGEKKH